MFRQRGRSEQTLKRRPQPPVLARSELLSETRRAILAIVKREGSSTLGELAQELEVSYETVRQQVAGMKSEGWLEPRLERSATVGRPTSRYRLTAAGEHLFPKHYDVLAQELLDGVVALFGHDGLRALLEHLSERRVRHWRPRLEGLSLRDKLEALRGVYLEDDPFTSVEEGEGGELRLIERNCPFLHVASERPALCSLTVSTLARLLGRRVVREERFQNGDGRCVFRVLSERLVADAFEPEDAEAAIGRPLSPA